MKKKVIKAWAVMCRSACRCGILQVVLTEIERDVEIQSARLGGDHLEVVEVEIRILGRVR